MDEIGLFEAKNRLSEICSRVAERRQPVTVLRRGRPLVRIVPVDDGRADDDVWSARQRFLSGAGGLKDDFELPSRRRERRAAPLLGEKRR